MRRQAIVAGLLFVGVAAIVGCHHDKHRVAVQPVEELKIPTVGDPRFDNAPTANYRKPRAKQEEQSLIGNKMGGPGPLGPGGL